MTLLYAVTLFVSAVLLFSVQPMVGKMALPALGGTPAVWNTCMVFFQAALLAGYAYAHGTVRWLGVRRQAALHIVLLTIPLFVLPITLAADSKPPSDANPAFWLLGQLCVSVALPFFVVSTGAPLLQLWFAHTGRRGSKDPYFLYAASNLGSLLALLSYPVLIEPSFRLDTQAALWTAGYGLLVVLAFVCAVVMWRGGAPPCGSSLHGEGEAAAPTMSRRLWWIALAFVPSSLMLGVTAHITTDIAAVPLFWVIPLALYLLTFVLVFAGGKHDSSRWASWLLPYLFLPIALLTYASFRWMSWMTIPVHLAGFFVAAMVCHGELARTRPATQYLTQFYLLMSVGGVLGGIFNSLIAPMIFNSVVEYPLAMVLACLLRPGKVERRKSKVERRKSKSESRKSKAESRKSKAESRKSKVESRKSEVESGKSEVESGKSEVESGKSEVESRKSKVESRKSEAESRKSEVESGKSEVGSRHGVAPVFNRWMDLGWPVVLGIVVVVAVMVRNGLGLTQSRLGVALVFGVPAFICFAFKERPIRFGLGFAVVLLSAGLFANPNVGKVLYTCRNFFGVKRVVLDTDGKFHRLYHGSTTHGLQSTDPAQRDVPLSYYHHSGPLGDVFRVFSGPEAKPRVCVIGLGTGSMVAYIEPGQHFTFLEIDPAVERIARDTRFFTFMQHCRGSYEVRLGDGRINLAEAADRSFDMIVLDAFSSDAVPTHLLSREALALYLSKLDTDGILVFHISNRHLNFQPMVAKLAEQAGLACLSRTDIGLSADQRAAGKTGSHWIVMGQRYESIARLADDFGWYVPPVLPGTPVWTDQYCDLLSLWGIPVGSERF